MRQGVSCFSNYLLCCSTETKIFSRACWNSLVPYPKRNASNRMTGGSSARISCGIITNLSLIHAPNLCPAREPPHLNRLFGNRNEKNKTMNSKERGNITRVGIVGAGYVSTYHVRALQSLKSVRIVGITDVDLRKGQQTASGFGIQFFSSTQEMYAQKPDVVHILTPPSSHCVL